MYDIIRFREGQKYEYIKTVNTLEEAQEHCEREDTHGDGWFDGYREVEEDGQEETSSDYSGT